MGGRRTPKKRAIAALVMSELDGATSGQIGKRLNMPSSTVREILAGNSQIWAALRNDADYLRYAQEAKRDLQLSYSEIARQSLEQAERQLPNASYAQAMLGSAIALDKILKLDCVFRRKSTPVPRANRHSFRLKSALIPRQIGTRT